VHLHQILLETWELMIRNLWYDS